MRTSRTLDETVTDCMPAKAWRIGNHEDFGGHMPAHLAN